MSLNATQRLEELADELTRRLGIAFQAAGDGNIVFRNRMRITDWAVPLIFDGHAAREREAIVPKDFVGHALWPVLRAYRTGRNERQWWYCNMPPAVADAILDELRGYEDDTDGRAEWVVGEDVLLEGMYQRRRVA